MPRFHISSDPILELIEAPPFRGSLRKQRSMHVFRRVPTRATNHHMLALFLPFQDGPGADTQLSTDLGGHRDLALSGYL
jgi:hypothetical protein